MKFLITGVTGTIGTVLTKLLLRGGHEVVGVSRDEFKQSKFEFKNDVKLCLCDIRDLDSLILASRGVDIIVHTAAMKHVDLMERNPQESIKTNIEGTQNVLSAQLVNGIERVVMLSTDKAVYPINVYGHCKAIAEKLVVNANSNNQVVRYGNVLNSRGSVISAFRQQLSNGGIANITDERMTRFWIKIEDAAQLILSVMRSNQPGVHVPEMKAAHVTLIADAILSEIQSVDCQARYNIIGMRPGEKINECLKSRYEEVWGNDSVYDVYSDRVTQFTLKEMRELVRGEL